MFSYGSFSELTFSGNKSATRVFNSKTINVGLFLKKNVPVSLRVINVEPPENAQTVVKVTLQINKNKGLEL